MDDAHLAAKYARINSSIGAYLRYLRQQAVRRAGTVELDDADIRALWDKQDGRCAYTNWRMTKTLGRGIVPTNCSIDRISSEVGYVQGNVQLVCRCVNTAKSALPEHQFVRMCEAVVTGQKSEGDDDA